ncbi:MAG: hypothetical protein HY582_00750 [Candidatus Omnitrophica bacterium]|nr:hypothetical protein [Candidatus Omnitrophota bacterium]
MKRKNILLGVMLALAVAMWNPAILLAAEHGGSTVNEHGGKEHGGEAVGEGEENVAATIREAASILKSTHPELAAKLEKIADAEERE